MNFDDLTLFIFLFQIITVCLATKYYKKYKNSTEKYFLHFLWYTIINESIGIYTVYYLKISYIEIYIIFIFLSFLFYFHWMLKIIKSKIRKKVIIALSVLFSGVAIYNFFTLEWNNYHYSTFVCGSIIYILLSLFFFSQLLNDKKVIHVKQNLKFWIATGLLLFNVGMIPLLVLSDLFSADDSLRVIILISLNLILYTCYSLGFIWSKKEQN